jgi:hypothetical protein
VNNQTLVLAERFVQLQKELNALKAQLEAVTKAEGPQGLPGKDGKDGKNGLNGKDGLNGRDGVDGTNGKDGKDGKDGVSVVDAKVDFDGALVLTLSDGNIIDAGFVVSTAEKGDMFVYKSGAVQLSKYTANVLSIAGFIEVTDVDGVTRKLAVVE